MVVPGIHGTEGSIAAPRAAEADAVIAGRRAGVGVGTGYAVVPVPAPFSHASAHVVYAKRVCVLALYFVGFIAAVIPIPRYIIYVVASAVFVLDVPASLAMYSHSASVGRRYPLAFLS